MSNPCYSAGVNHIPDSNAAPLQLLSAAVPAAMADSDVADSAPADHAGLGSATVLVQTGVASGTPDSFTVDAKLQHCSTRDGVFTDVPGASIDQITTESASGQASFSLAGVKQFVRVEIAVTLTGGTTPKITVASTLLLSP